MKYVLPASSRPTIRIEIPKELLGKPLEIKVEERRPRHTSEQEGLYRASLHAYGKELGYTARESDHLIHETLLCEAFGVDKAYVSRGIVRERPLKRSASLSIEDYSTLIDTLFRHAAENGVVLGETA